MGILQALEKPGREREKKGERKKGRKRGREGGGREEKREGGLVYKLLQIVISQTHPLIYSMACFLDIWSTRGQNEEFFPNHLAF